MGIGSWLGGAIGTFISPGAGTAAGSFAGGQIESLIGGRDLRTNPCPGSPQISQVARAFQTGPPDRMARVVAAYQAVHPTKSFPYADPYEFISSIMGGSDCRVGTTLGRALHDEGIAFIRDFGGPATVTESPAAGSWVNPNQPTSSLPPVDLQVGDAFRLRTGQGMPWYAIAGMAAAAVLVLPKLIGKGSK